MEASWAGALESTSVVESGSVLESSSLLESGVSPGGLELLLPQAASKVRRQEGPTTASRLLAFMNVLGAGLGIRRLAGLRPGVPALAGDTKRRIRAHRATLKRRLRVGARLSVSFVTRR
jgi:hypothetical protein